MIDEDSGIENKLADGWRIVDPPAKFTPEMWDEFLSYFDGEYEILVWSQGKDAKGPWVRGQLLVSPEGIKNCNKNLAKRKEI